MQLQFFNLCRYPLFARSGTGRHVALKNNLTVNYYDGFGYRTFAAKHQLPRNALNRQFFRLSNIRFLPDISDSMSNKLSTATGDGATKTANAKPSGATIGKDACAVDFEVQGTVQGVFFRKYTQKRAQELGLAGWVQNTESGAVIGHLEGSRSSLDAMQDLASSHWQSTESYHEMCFY